MARKPNPSAEAPRATGALKKSAELSLDGLSAVLKRAAVRASTAAAYVGDGAHITAYQRLIEARQLIDMARSIADEIEHDHAYPAAPQVQR